MIHVKYEYTVEILINIVIVAVCFLPVVAWDMYIVYVLSLYISWLTSSSAFGFDVDCKLIQLVFLTWFWICIALRCNSVSGELMYCSTVFASSCHATVDSWECCYSCLLKRHLEIPWIWGCGTDCEQYSLLCSLERAWHFGGTYIAPNFRVEE